ncbi:uncharacterized protein SPAPADRAFT_59491 [Spathaspora passalidarum NRRL Y-27907]|uniref:Uncharacterized protein n=1 Tax=Spathaspora passalidarum (strain NRRL Y-27907 / 11-Y1) TaxID=619300 RepID=G3AK17_SPAPN|nr:uncharacterized protein SPAPADRAFT_59491 [Spathaspora passalidarum NRRL Y-27907]EGW34068.1 hypothetical protein SPAPADRAFT_59491 [Spathaspora passalidarum NRRL Y-27907]
MTSISKHQENFHTHCMQGVVAILDPLLMPTTIGNTISKNILDVHTQKPEKEIKKKKKMEILEGRRRLPNNHVSNELAPIL